MGFKRENGTGEAAAVYFVSKMKNDKVKYVFVAFFIGAVFLHIGAISNRLKIRPDGALYVGLSRSLYEGRGFHFNGQDGAIAPPLCPLYLIIPLGISHALNAPDTWIIWAKIFHLLIIILLTWGSYKLARQYVDHYISLLIAFMVLCNIGIFQFSTLNSSDVLYACISVWALNVFHTQEHRKAYKAVFPVLLSLAILTRTIGLTMFVACILAVLPGVFRKKTSIVKAAKAFGVIAAAYAPFFFWNMKYSLPHHSYTTFLRGLYEDKSMVDILRQVAGQAALTVTRTVQLVLNIEDISLSLFFTLPVFLLIIAGFLTLLFMKRTLTEVYVGVYLCIINVWCYDQGVRYYLPLLPMFLIYAVVALQYLLKRLAVITGGRAKWVCVGYFVLLTLPLVLYVVYNHHLPSLVVIVRKGLIFSALASVFLFGLLAASFFNRPVKTVITHAVWSYVGVIILCFLSYMGYYILLEHGIITHRKPMLCGYDCYLEAGRWLKNQDVAEPIMCSNNTVIHLASGKITTIPDGWRIKYDQLKQEFNANKIGGVLFLSPAIFPKEADDDLNLQLATICREHPDDFQMISRDKKNVFFLYALRGKDVESIENHEAALYGK